MATILLAVIVVLAYEGCVVGLHVSYSRYLDREIGPGWWIVFFLVGMGVAGFWIQHTGGTGLGAGIYLLTIVTHILALKTWQVGCLHRPVLMTDGWHVLFSAPSHYPIGAYILWRAAGPPWGTQWWLWVGTALVASGLWQGAKRTGGRPWPSVWRKTWEWMRGSVR